MYSEKKIDMNIQFNSVPKLNPKEMEILKAKANSMKVLEEEKKSKNTIYQYARYLN